MAKRAFGDRLLEILQGDITLQDTDAIVNAANSSLLGGGGVDGAIHTAGGPKILEACQKIRARSGSLPTGRAVITTAGRLPTGFVIHTVGPVWQGGSRGEAEALASCYRESLLLAAENGLTSVAFPSISTGAFGYPVKLAAAVALDAIKSALPEAGTVRLVRLVLFSRADLATYEAFLLDPRFELS